MKTDTQPEYGLSHRTALIIRPTMAFIRWVKAAVANTEFADEYKEIVKEKSRQDGHVYLVPIIDGDDELAQYITSNYGALIENELREWQVDPDLWPTSLPEALFRQWFTVSFHELVFELPILQNPHSQLGISPLQSVG